jgi:hypothetical protein
LLIALRDTNCKLRPCRGNYMFRVAQKIMAISRVSYKVLCHPNDVRLSQYLHAQDIGTWTIGTLCVGAFTSYLFNVNQHNVYIH